MYKLTRKLVWIALAGALSLPATSLATENLSLNFRKLEWQRRGEEPVAVGAAIEATVGGLRASTPEGLTTTPAAADARHEKWIDVLSVDWTTHKPARRDPGFRNRAPIPPGPAAARHGRSRIPSSGPIPFTGLE